MPTSPASNPARHVIVGAGATGTATARLLAGRGASVIVVTRSGSGPSHPNIELIAADATDSQRLTTISAGASAIYNCANPPYHRWTSDWPPLASSLLTAAERTGAVLVILSNLYGYANPTRPMRATDPLDPSSVKGGVRADMWHAALAAHERGAVRVTEARASDFIGPNIGQTAHMGDRVLDRVRKGKSVSLLGDLDALHSWTAIDDVAMTLATIAEDERAWGRAWHVPTVAPISQRDLVHRMCKIAGVEPVKVKGIPNLALRALGVFVPAMRELREVAYQFEAPFIIDSARNHRHVWTATSCARHDAQGSAERIESPRGPDLLVRR